MPDKVRIDKWLWAVRLYKTRSLATEACKAGRVKIDGKSVKPSRTVEGGEWITARQAHQVRKVRVLRLLEKRVGAAIATACYEDDSPPAVPDPGSRAFFYASAEKRDRGSGRPTKRERREIDRFKDPGTGEDSTDLS